MSDRPLIPLGIYTGNNLSGTPWFVLVSLRTAPLLSREILLTTDKDDLIPRLQEDPMADGEVRQRASLCALGADVFGLIFQVQDLMLGYLSISVSPCL